jgi:O-antigen/teichoic acid export membrane protein
LLKITFAHKSFLLISSSVLRLIAQLVVLYLYAKQLSYIDYGLYQSVWLYINVISVIATFGLSSLLLSTPINSIQTWIQQNKKLFTLFAIAVNTIPIIYLLLTANDFSNTIKLLLIILSFVQNISIIAETVAIKYEKEKWVLASNIIFSIGYLSIHLLALYTNYSLPFLLIGINILFTVKAIVLFAVSSLQMQQQSIMPSSILLSGKQWFYLGINDVLGVVFKWLDKWVILFFVSVTQFAIYFNGSYEIPIFGLMLSAVGNIMLVELSKGDKENTALKIKSLFQHSTLLLSAIVFPSFCFLLFYNTPFFTLLFGVKYADAIPIFIISIFVLPIRITNYTAVLQTYGRSNLIVKGAIVDVLVAIVLMAVLYPTLKMKGLALAFVLSTYIQAGYYLWHTSKLINKKISYFFPFKKLLIVMGVSASITALGYYATSNLSYPINLITGIVICMATTLLLLLYFYKKSKNEIAL